MISPPAEVTARTESLAGRAATFLPARVRPRSRVRRVYERRLADERRERMFISSLSFLLTFAAARAVTHAIKDDALPVGNVESGGRHIHHCVFGIAGLLATGYAWTAQLGTGKGFSQRRASRATAAVYGASSALTLDEFALWLDMEDDYWTKEGRKSVDAAVIFAALLSAGAWGAPFLRGLARRALT